MSIFLSYSRRDGEALAQRLRDDLQREGIDVWWDQTSMDSRGLSFLQELRDAIANSDRLVLVITPESVKSRYVAAEWCFAAAACVAITPVLASAGIEELPEDLGRLHAIDFRPPEIYTTALQNLTRVLQSPPAPLGHLYNDLPALPANHIPSVPEVAIVMQLVGGDLKGPVVITSARQTSALQGMGGVGKTVLATEFARNCETRRAFPDGVVWLRFGAGADNALLNLETLKNIYETQRPTARTTSAATQLGELLANRVCLIILDDVWHLAAVEPFTAAAGPRTRILITTRDASIVSSLAAPQLGLKVFDEAKSLQLLAEWVGVPATDLPRECAAIAQECGYLPFALSVCGALARSNVGWTDILSALSEADLEYLSTRLPNYPYTSVFRSIKVGIDQLKKEDPLAAELLCELAVFRPNRPFPESAVCLIWQCERRLSDREARKILSHLRARSLLLASESGFAFHDLVYDYLVATSESVLALQAKLLRGYKLKAGSTWDCGPRDGYFFESLPYHLCAAGRSEEMLSLLTDCRWLMAKLAATEPAALLEDFRLTQTDAGHEAIAAAILLASHRLQDPGLLRGQLAGRLQPGSSPTVDLLLRSIDDSNTDDVIMPLSMCLTDTTTHLRFTVQASDQAIECIALAPDQPIALISSGTSGIVEPKLGGLFAIDVSTGNRLFSLSGHTFDIEQVVIFADGERAASASRDETVRVWDLRTQACLRVLDAGDAVKYVAASGRYIVGSGCNSPGVRVWNGTTGQAVEAPSLEYADEVAAAGHYAFARHRNTLKCWPFDQPSSVFELAAVVEAFDVSAEGSSAVTLSSSGIITIWDVESKTSLTSMAITEFPDGKSYHYIRFFLPGYLVSLSGDWEGEHASVMTVWRVSDGVAMLRERSHSTVVTALATSERSSLVLTGTIDGEIKVWDLDPARLTDQPATDSGFVSALCVRNERPEIVALRDAGALEIFSKDGLTPVDSIGAVDRDHDSMLARMDDGSLFTYATSGTSLCIADFRGGMRLRHPLDATALCLDPDPHFIWCALRRQAICRWKVDDLTRGGELSPDIAFRLPYVPNMTADAYGSDPFTSLFPMDIAISPDGATGLVTWGGSRRSEFAMGGWQFPVATFRARDGQLISIKTFRNHVVRKSVFCEDGNAVLSASYRGVVKWLVRDADIEMRVPHETDEVFFVAVLPDGSTAVSATVQGEILVWNIATGQRRAQFFTERILTAAALTQDGRQLVVAIRNGGIHALRLPSSLSRPAVAQ